MRITAIILFVLLSSLAFGQTFTKEIDNIYNFQPSKLTDKEQELKGPSLDNFWNKVGGDTTQYLPQLRTELKTDNHNPFFYYDGSGLLLSLTNNKVDKELAIEAIAKCDINDISRRIYVRTLNHLANEGFNVTKPAIKILYDNKYSFFIPQHAMVFNQGYCLTYMLVPQHNKFYIDTLIAIFKDLDTIAQKSVITTLWFSCDCKSDEFIQSISMDKNLPNEISDYAKRMIAYIQLSKDQKSYLKMISKAQLNELRRSALSRFSDEAIEELDMTTKIWRKENKCH
ncbi:MAG: hypothetical protein JWM14_1552 [Chitinophagaceae bacterium]|nr:hypothetical protein [Chitinophagaceae bacterium]